MEAIPIVLAGFLVMEPVTAFVHRYVMHGVGWALHRSHHRGTDRGLEANDAFPVVFASIVCVGFAAGFNLDGWSVLVPIAIGVTLYGAAYALVHDVYVHGRVRLFGGRRVAVLERLAEAHRLHHRFNRAPYGMLLPVVPRDVRERITAVPTP
jgi:beta-carotene 3-hydroxylase